MEFVETGIKSPPAEIASSDKDKARRTKRTKLGRVTAVVVAIAMGGAVQSSPVSAETGSAIDGKHNVSPAKIEPGAISQASEAVCGDPAFDAPTYQQLRTMRCLINHARTNPLTDNELLDETARLKTNDEVRCGNSLIPISHYACKHPPFLYFPEGWTRSGEILAWGDQSFGSARAIFGAWMQSPEHRPIIENENYTYLGLDMQQTDGMNLWTGEFGQL